MSSSFPTQFDHVSAVTKANVYFEGKVISHTLIFEDGSKKTLGLIYPGTYHFNTDAPERMEIVAGSCQVQAAGTSGWTTYQAGEFFEITGKSSFDIRVDESIAEYICSFIQS